MRRRRGPCVYAKVDGEKRRIVAARTSKGALEVKILTGEHRVWYPAETLRLPFLAHRGRRHARLPGFTQPTPEKGQPTRASRPFVGE